MSGVANAVLIQIWHRGLLLAAESWTWGGRWGKSQAVPPPHTEGPGIVERLRVEVVWGPSDRSGLESWLVHLPAVWP